jgi:hypothetical protein
MATQVMAKNTNEIYFLIFSRYNQCADLPEKEDKKTKTCFGRNIEKYYSYFDSILSHLKFQHCGEKQRLL